MIILNFHKAQNLGFKKLAGNKYADFKHKKDLMDYYLNFKKT